MSEPYTVVGGGAIGGTLAFHLARAGHPVRIVDTDAAHVAAIRRRGLVLRGPGGDACVPVEACSPEEAPAVLGRVLLAVKAQATEQVLPWLAPRLAQDGFVVSLQNGLNEQAIAAAVGTERTVGAFVNLFADVVEPGVVQDGGAGALVVGEPDGRITPRVERIVADLQAWGPAKATANVEGFLWSKLGFGAMLATTALADAPMADLIDRHRPLMHAITAEVLAAAGDRVLEPFDQFDPGAYLPSASSAEREAATDRLVAWLRTQPKDRSGIWRDIAVRRRPVEVHHHYRPVLALGGVPLLTAVLALLRDVESGRRLMSEDHLTELERML
ncbi:ketopantoate reductase family protein [Amycolatopsis methanolica]|uniref:Ketopantoate reductase ApbA/PanE domain protein n=1 Tax=Amycolatopsis methanolica 239 TaxID=1068978 RepID=A0A076MUF1_AMYME|nr:2-dehydropantoate 2-reductase N-terminal domain-containing protein [Amycolatopsis methanolica]AIJ24384.1 ketopantoate reductase ApbA/PanE domain protein [Amycolatopsis methanolica 239]